MTLKKLLLIIFIGVIPAQSLALTTNQKIGLFYIGAITFMGAVAGGIYCWDEHKEKVEREFWNNKSEEEMGKLVAKFMNKVEKRLSTQLKKLRTHSSESDYTIKGNLKCFYFIRQAITKSDIWLKRLEERAFESMTHQMKELRIELIRLRDALEIYIDKDLIELYEKSKNQQHTVFVPFAVPYAYNY